MPISDAELLRMLEGEFFEESEDLQMIQPDGSRACINYELTEGFQLLDSNGKPVRDRPYKE